MFSRFRNLFSKAKSENSPEPQTQPEPKLEPEPESAERDNAYGNGAAHKMKLEKNPDHTNAVEYAKTTNLPAKTIDNNSEESLNVLEDQITGVICEEQSSALTGKVELTQISSSNEHQNDAKLAHELNAVTLESMSTVTESILETTGNSKTEESINMPANEEIVDEESGHRSEEMGCFAAGEEKTTNNGNGLEVPVKVDKAEIRVTTESPAVGGEQNDAANAVDESEKAVGENTLSQQDEHEQTKTEVDLDSSVDLIASIAANGNADVETPTKKTFLNPLIETTTLPETSLGANETIQIASSIAVDELATDNSSPAGDMLTQSSSSDGTTTNESIAESSSIVIKPTGNNEIACTAISNKLQEIAEVAESLDASIRDVQQDADALEVNLTGSAAKKREAMRSNSSEDWHSRSTEDDSFVTPSEGNFTPHSHSSSYHTASGRTSSYISSDKNSFDVSEADDSTFASTYEIPADINMSFDGSEQSFVSAQQQECTPSPLQQHQQQQHHTEEPIGSGAYALPPAADEGDGEGDGSSIADVEELHSQSVTPTPGDGDVEQYNCQSIPVESESDLDSSFIVDAPSIAVLTEETVPVTSVTPEVSTCSSTELQQQMQNHNNNNTNNSNTNSQKPNAAWRRSKYYENITKQTIKGFL